MFRLMLGLVAAGFVCSTGGMAEPTSPSSPVTPPGSTPSIPVPASPAVPGQVVPPRMPPRMPSYYAGLRAAGGKTFLDKLPTIECATENASGNEATTYKIRMNIEGEVGYARFKTESSTEENPNGSRHSNYNLDFSSDEFVIRKASNRAGLLEFFDVETYSNKFLIRIQSKSPLPQDPNRFAATFSLTGRGQLPKVQGRVNCTVPAEIKPSEGVVVATDTGLKLEWVCGIPQPILPWRDAPAEPSNFFVSIGSLPNGTAMAVLSAGLAPTVGDKPSFDKVMKRIELETMVPVMTDGYYTFRDKKSEGEAFSLTLRPGAPLANPSLREGDPGAGASYLSAKFSDDISNAERDFYERLFEQGLVHKDISQRAIRSDLRCSSAEMQPFDGK